MCVHSETFSCTRGPYELSFSPTKKNRLRTRPDRRGTRHRRTRREAVCRSGVEMNTLEYWEEN